MSFLAGHVGRWKQLWWYDQGAYDKSVWVTLDMFPDFSGFEFCHLEMGIVIPLLAAVMTMSMPCTLLGTEKVPCAQLVQDELRDHEHVPDARVLSPLPVKGLPWHLSNVWSVTSIQGLGAIQQKAQVAWKNVEPLPSSSS